MLDKLQAEADGIFLWALTGLRRLIANKYKFSETARTNAELQKYRTDSNSVLSFIEEYCTVDVNAEAERSSLFECYRDYCKDCNLQPVSQKTFNKDLESSFPTISRAKDKVGSRHYHKRCKF